MKQEELQQIKEEYTRINHLRKIATLLNEEKAALEEEQMVKRYIEVYNKLNQMKEYLEYDDSDSIAMAIEKTNITDTNKIYVCLGTYKRIYDIAMVNCSHYALTSHDDQQAEYSEYVDIEKDLIDSFQVDIQERAEFEENNDIIYLNKNDVSHASFYKLQPSFYKLQHDFFKNVIENGQEKTISTIKKQLLK